MMIVMGHSYLVVISDRLSSSIIDVNSSRDYICILKDTSSNSIQEFKMSKQRQQHLAMVVGGAAADNDDDATGARMQLTTCNLQ